MNAAALYNRAVALGLKLEPAGDRLAVTPGRLCPPDFAAELRAHKAELMQWLSVGPLLPDEVPWLHVAKQVLAGEFGGADKATRESLRIGLRSINHPLTRQAMSLLNQAP